MKITEINNVTEQPTQAPVQAESKGRLNARTVAYAAVVTGLAVAVATVAYYAMQSAPVAPRPRFESLIDFGTQCFGKPEVFTQWNPAGNTEEVVTPINPYAGFGNFVFPEFRNVSPC
jgi:hypothetical protein